MVLVVSSQTRTSRTVKEHLRLADLYQRRLILVWVGDDEHAPTPPPGWRETVLVDGHEAHYTAALEAIEAILGQRRSISSLLPDSDAAEETEEEESRAPRNPYKGLHAFTADDAGDFFGRERLIDALVKDVAGLVAVEQPTSEDGRLLAVIGPSGSGKSSVVMAGLLPRLRQGALPGSETWVYLEPIVPGKHPIEALGLTLAAHFPDRSFTSLREDLEDDATRGLHVLATQLVKRRESWVVLLVDQFEELFTQTEDEDERRRFMQLLLTAITEPYGPLIVLLTLRADFSDRPMLYPELGQLIERHRQPVFPMELDELRTTIEQPAELPDVRLSFEGNLVGDLLFEMQGQAGALPLLEFTLEQLFARRNGHRLTLSAYREIGGVKGALLRHAEKTYAALPSEEQRRLARALFLRLIDIGTTEQDVTRRRAALSEFSLADAATTHLMRETADVFIAARLLTTNEVSGTITIEVSHEAVIREWRRLADWIREAREDLHLLRVIREDAAEWRRYGRSQDRLYRGTQLAEALAWRERSLLSLDEETFLEASAAEQARQETLLADRQQQEAWLRKRYTRRIVLVGLVGLGLTVSAAAVIGILFGGNKQSSSLPPLPLPYSYRRHTSAVNSVAWSPDGRQLASASSDTTVQVWDAASGATLLTYTGHSSSVWSVAWSPDGTLLASAGQDKTVRVWDAMGRSLLTYGGHTADVNSVAWSPNGKRLASASSDTTVQVWDASRGMSRGMPLLTYTGHTDVVHSVAWSSDGKRLASAGFDETVRVWDGSSGTTLLTYTGHNSGVESVAWSPDGKQLALASNDQTVRVWDANSGQIVLIYKVHTASVNSVVWSPYGKHLASASQDKTVQVWDANSGHTLLTYKGHTADVNSVVWSPDGIRLASASNDQTVQVWEASGQTRLTYTGHTNAVTSVAWSPDGTRLASASLNVQVWDASSGSLLVTYRERYFGFVYSVAWSPDGKRLASAGENKTVEVWDTTSGHILLTYSGHAADVNSIAWSPDGTRLASADGSTFPPSADHTVRVWDATSGQTLLTYNGHTDIVNSVAWSIDGRRLASASVDQTVQVWDATNGHTLLTYGGHTRAVESVAWSPDGRRLASASADGSVQMWDATNGQTLFTCSGHTDVVKSVVWSPDGKRLASASVDQTVRVWDAMSGHTLLIYTEHTDVVTSVAWSPDGEHLASASNDETVRVWLWLQG